MTPFYGPEARSIAAKAGWQTRRQGKTPWRRFLELDGRVQDGPARLYACELAASVLHHYIAAFPDDPRPACLLWVARRYALGDAADAERFGMYQLARAWVAALLGDRRPRTPAERVLYILVYCLHTPVRLWSIVRMVRELRGTPEDAFYREVVSALEALPQRPRKARPATNAAAIERSA